MLPNERLLMRCESCGVALEEGHAPDPRAEWAALLGTAEDGEVSIPNRASLQATIGMDGWAAIDASPGRLLLTPRSLECLAERADAVVGAVRTPVTGRGQAWMWQTLLNGLTLQPNFAREVAARELTFSTARSRWRFAIDAMVTVLAAPLVLLVSIPLELAAVVARRGGVIAARVGDA